MLENMDVQVFDTEPSKIFINIGTNDISNPSISFEEALTHTITNYEKILVQIKEKSSGNTGVYDGILSC